VGGVPGARWRRWLIVGLVAVNAGWMVADGSRALVVGDYVTPATGPHAGRLGPWSDVVRAVGIPPRSTGMKVIFVAYGLAFLAMTAAFLGNVPRARSGMIVMALLGLWHLPFGTLINLMVLALLRQPSAGGDVSSRPPP